MSKEGHIYILQEREFIKTGENIYKIGHTCQDNVQTRIKQYSKGSKLLYSDKITDVKECEKSLIKIFRSKYNWKKNYGNEYFEGDIDDMILEIAIFLTKKKVTNNSDKKTSKSKPIQIKGTYNTKELLNNEFVSNDDFIGLQYNQGELSYNDDTGKSDYEESHSAAMCNIIHDKIKWVKTPFELGNESLKVLNNNKTKCICGKDLTNVKTLEKGFSVCWCTITKQYLWSVPESVIN